MARTMDSQYTFTRCANLIGQADGLLITAGAGLGVDAGLPDFRGKDGFWRAYPALSCARLHFQDIACPDAFRERPRLAWGFYGHRLKMYRETEPGPTLTILMEVARRIPDGTYVFTSNVDGAFQKAGFEPARVVECHGTIHRMQCLEGCLDDIWSADYWLPEVDDDTCMLMNDVPTCPHCGGVARPNILMFGDSAWIDHSMRAQHARLQGGVIKLSGSWWLRSVQAQQSQPCGFSARARTRLSSESMLTTPRLRPAGAFHCR